MNVNEWGADEEREWGGGGAGAGQSGAGRAGGGHQGKEFTSLRPTKQTMSSDRSMRIHCCHKRPETSEGAAARELLAAPFPLALPFPLAFGRLRLASTGTSAGLGMGPTAEACSNCRDGADMELTDGL